MVCDVLQLLEAVHSDVFHHYTRMVVIRSTVCGAVLHSCHVQDTALLKKREESFKFPFEITESFLQHQFVNGTLMLKVLFSYQVYGGNIISSMLQFECKSANTASLKPLQISLDLHKTLMTKGIFFLSAHMKS